MRNVILVTIFIINNLYSQNKDTIFIQKDSLNKVFFINNKKTEYHIQLRDFKEFPKNSFVSKKKNIVNGNWIPLYQFKNQYYLYHPCDVGISQRIQISKGHLTIESFEYYDYAILGKIIKYSNNHYGLKYKDFNKEKKLLEIYIIDELKGIAVFKFREKDQVFFQLMVNAEKVNDYYVIVNYCEFSKIEEFQFEEINFQKLLKNQSFN